VSAATDEQFSRRQSAPCGARNGHAFVRHIESRTNSKFQIPNSKFTQRSFSVARLNSAKMIATMTKRVMTFGSLQPISSK
jgi:hypothetical protein